MGLTPRFAQASLRLSEIAPGYFVEPPAGRHFSARVKQKSPHKAGIFCLVGRGLSNKPRKVLIFAAFQNLTCGSYRQSYRQRDATLPLTVDGTSAAWVFR